MIFPGGVRVTRAGREAAWGWTAMACARTGCCQWRVVASARAGERGDGAQGERQGEARGLEGERRI